ncbi:penicillin acylase family protein [Ramlibacter sp.]|uniref:penicillin acylase family protein n=1 Tax=Ramlibacter sp. TaxID=1917967 RepID=UPI003D0D5014
MRIFKLTLKALLALVLLAMAAAAVYVWRSFPALDGEVRAAGLAAPVQVRRDASDVTHIEARSQADAYFALGWVHAQERGWQLEFNRRVMRGELSEAFGATTLDTDKLMRRLGIMRAAKAQWAALPAEYKPLLVAYANGINAFHATGSQALPPEFHLTGVKPGAWAPEDSMGWALMMALDLGGNWGTEFARLAVLQRLDTQQLWQLMPPYAGDAPATAVDLAALYRSLNVYRPAGATPAKTAVNTHPLDEWARGLGHLEGIGSNNWVVAGSHTQGGKPLVANDPHLGLSAPAIWYFARIKAPALPGGKPLDAIGATLPGLPAVVLGRTAGVAWGFTNTGPDVQDLYLEQIDPANAKRYRTPEGWAEFDSREETIKVKGRPDEKLTVLSTRHGPVLSHGHAPYEEVIDTKRYALALRWSALDADNLTVAAGLRANYAQTADELFEAYSAHHSPMQSVVAADTQGRTAYQAIGRVPLRRPENDLRGVAPAPGWDAKYDWAGWIPASETPRVAHAAIEKKGWHATANQRIHGKDYPHFIGSDWNSAERFDRIETLLAKTPKHTAQSMRDVQADIVSLAAQRLLPILRATKSTHPQAEGALALFRDFDGTMSADGAAPLVLSVWADELTRGLVVPKIGEARFRSLYGKRTFRAGLETMLLEPKASASWCDPAGCGVDSAKALDRALDRIVAEQGRDVALWRWGKAHPAMSVHRPLGNVAVLARFFDVRVPTGGDPWTVNVGQYWASDPKMPFANRHAASLRAVYDLADLEKSQFIYQTGQSGLVFSSRYRDMSQEWAQVRYRTLQLNPSAWRHASTLTP